jgi:hypothetical protein
LPVDVAFNYTDRRDKFKTNLNIYEGNQNILLESKELL